MVEDNAQKIAGKILIRMTSNFQKNEIAIFNNLKEDQELSPKNWADSPALDNNFQTLFHV